MNKDELKTKIQELADELGTTLEKAYTVIGKVTNEKIAKALNGENDKDLAEIENFFKSREYAFSIYTP